MNLKDYFQKAKKYCNENNIYECTDFCIYISLCDILRMRPAFIEDKVIDAIQVEYEKNLSLD